MLRQKAIFLVPFISFEHFSELYELFFSVSEFRGIWVDYIGLFMLFALYGVLPFNLCPFKLILCFLNSFGKKVVEQMQLVELCFEGNFFIFNRFFFLFQLSQQFFLV